LRFDRQGRDGSCLKALDRDWLAGLLAEPVRTVLDARQRLVDLCDQFALAVTSAQLDRPVGLRRGAVGEIRGILILVLEVLEGLPSPPENIFPPCEHFLPEIVALTIIHERLFVGRPIGFALIRPHLSRLPGAKRFFFVRDPPPRRPYIVPPRRPQSRR